MTASCGKTPPGLDDAGAQSGDHLRKEGIFFGLPGTYLPDSNPSLLRDVPWSGGSGPSDPRPVLQGLYKDQSRVPPMGTS